MDLFAVNPSGSNYLYKNLGETGFEKVTNCPIIHNSSSFTSGSTWGDYDNDGIIDVFLAAQGGTDVLFRGTGNGNFQKITEGPLVIDGYNAYNAAWADYDNDSYLDLYVVTNTFMGSGQVDFFYHNNGDGTFSSIKLDMLGNEASDNTAIGWCDLTTIATSTFWFRHGIRTICFTGTMEMAHSPE